MSVQGKTITAVVWEHAPSKIQGTPLVVLLKLSGLTNSDGYAFPSMEHLARACGASVRSIQYAIRELEKSKLLKTRNRRGRSCHFYIQVEELLKLPLANPRDVAIETQTAVVTPQRDARWLAGEIEKVFRAELPDAQIPSDWQTAWTAELQKLFDAGHAVDSMISACRFARKHMWWAGELANKGVTALVANFKLIEEQRTKDAHGRAA
jgi:DNA-binding transcriptional MocR family regulator